MLHLHLRLESDEVVLLYQVTSLLSGQVVAVNVILDLPHLFEEGISLEHLTSQRLEEVRTDEFSQRFHLPHVVLHPGHLVLKGVVLGTQLRQFVLDGLSDLELLLKLVNYRLHSEHIADRF